MSGIHSSEVPKGQWRSYRYVGRADIIPTTDFPPRTLVSGIADVVPWLELRKSEADREGFIAATFVIDTDGQIWIADRRSEHVACARCGNVLSAGEIYFAVEDGPIRIARITNQSTGYCPEVSSWRAVDEALSRLEIPHPEGFQPEFEFRRCPKCLNIALVKDGDFSCLLCGEALPKTWNIEAE